MTDINVGASTSKPVKRKTGSWRTFRAIITEKCTGCGTCTDFCPENCIALVDRAGGKKIAKIDYDYCKGCLICKGVCPFKAIESKMEGRLK